ncbi:hypothetical protein HYX16_00265 [Candidatus Woesearchaeota archaeon]|nr:hypothetical protein [Candidatus Woesearchaeota archaeon]
MKYLIFLFILLLTCFASAEITIFKDEYFIGETFQAELNFLNLVDEIKISDISILNSNGLNTNIGVLLDKIDKEKYFVYFDVPDAEQGEYKLAINNIKYTENGVLKKETFTKNFRISKRSDDIISVNPAFINYFAMGKNFFKMEVTNKGENQVNVNIFGNDFLKASKDTLTINKESTGYFFLEIKEGVNNDFLNINYSSGNYKIPVYVLGSFSSGLNFFTEKNGKNEYLSSYFTELPFGSSGEKTLFLENKGSNLSNLKISLSDGLSSIIKPGFDNIDLFEKNKIISLVLFININRNVQKGSYTGNIIFKNDKVDISFPVTVSVTGSSLYDGGIAEEKEEISIEEPALEETENSTNFPEKIPKDNKLNNRQLSNLLIGLILLIFILVYLFIYWKTGKKR